MTKAMFILGRQPALGLAELESLYGADKLHPAGSQAALLDIEPSKIDFARLGGSIKLGKLLHTFDDTKWINIQNYLVSTMPKHLQFLRGKKLTLGLSTYGLGTPTKQLLATGLEIKKAVKCVGYSMRLVPNNDPALSSAQIMHNKLFTSDSWELLFVRDGPKIHMAQTTVVQDIDAYAARDQARPKRDARVGMLPPKLAQIIINLAVAGENTQITVLDPFCGTGVILQESYVMGYGIYGTDIDNRMVEYSDANLSWLAKGKPTPRKLLVADATNHTWASPFDTIASETYLGRPFSATPKPEILDEVIQDVDTIHKKFLLNVASQTKPGFRMCIAVPAWRIGNAFKHLPALDHLEQLGYTRVVFKNASNQDLIYYREGQIVGRELVTLIRK